ncbi:MAG: adenine-specific methyltransferase EcoRI family protein [bacterium]|nr:adenine-specific methyltransferase EcoRI family protein [bacterium]
MADNRALHRARKAEQDEFYTQLVDIENELRHYKGHFKGKVVYCNCDDPYESNFFKYFAVNFDALGLERLIATSYTGSPIAGEQLVLGHIETEGGRPRPHKIEMTSLGDLDGDGAIGPSDVVVLLKHNGNVTTLLEGDGDFRSAECVELLKQSDIVVTNPPFSLFRKYIAQLVEHSKEFLILGNKNAVTYKEIFPLLKDGRMWVGYTPMGREMVFDIPEDYGQQLVAAKKDRSYTIVDGVVKARSSSCWFTNLDHAKRHEPLILYKQYTPEAYPHYDNYDAINVDKTNDIPEDWDGVMGVPISFLDKHNPDQFEIVNANEVRSDDSVPLKAHGLIKDKESAIGGKPKYVRVAIRRVG